MNAVNPVHSSPLPSADAEPSMEEILASIRRIIADDSSLPHPTDALAREPGAPAKGDIAAAVGVHPAPASDVADVPPAPPPLDLHAPIDAALPEDPVSPAIPQSPSPEAPMVDSLSHLPPHPLAPEEAWRGSVELEPDPAVLTGHDAGVPHDPIPSGYVPPAGAPSEPEPLFSAATHASVAAAFNTLAASRFIASSEQLPGLVREMIRPLVKEWVDANLPDMVERIIVAEIERLARGGR